MNDLTPQPPAAADSPPVVRRMPQDLADQIAAGEVVERPASAVKELVENAIDAGATLVVVDLEEGGLKLIRVADNGSGMLRDDAALAIERHASSKLTSKAQLFAIETLGFRGEALPSIASVCRFSLLTKPHGKVGGTRVTVTGGQNVSVQDAASPPGTEVSVRDLFFNTPARLKFLKRTNTELKHVLEIIERCALAYPACGFRVSHNGRQLLDYPAVARMSDRLFSILGKDDSACMYELQPAEQDGVKATGWYSQPALTRRTASGIWVFVNGRFVRDKAVTAAIRNAYEGVIDRARYPVVVLHLAVPPRAVDVNVHPMKTEVRFHDPSAVFRATRRSFTQSLAACPWRPTAAGQDGQGVRPASTRADSEPLETQQTLPVRAYTLHSTERSAPIPTSVHRAERPSPPYERPRSVQPPDTRYQQPLRSVSRPMPAAIETMLQAGDSALPVAHTGYFASLTYIGPFAGTYLLLSDGDELIVVDQHAAHERITYERLKESWEQRRAAQQTLLIPRVLTLDPIRRAVLDEHTELFEALGFQIEHFGADDFAVTAIPVLVNDRAIDSLIEDTLDELVSDGHSRRVDRAIDAVLIRMACHGSIRAGKRMASEEVLALMHELDTIDFGANCPHGRPVWFKMTLAEIEKRFDRR